ncbi:PTS mannitol transporter subunit IICBA [Mobilicoccus massiliensis]|uniref:PTS mannitol transporter subunit IICBA n=1 Tax=Mobilicoccus massiliensis TaxID=1522310 RepID=UPI00058FE56C|nr:PTS mannitol transporter subunit IICBA [Mobilicoccus massiliensis]
MATTAAADAAPRTSVRVRVQQFGTFLSNMIMPNIGAIIAWGFVTALFIDVGPFPNPQIAAIVGPSIYFLLPILIAYTGGTIIHGTRGGVVGAFAVMGVILPASGDLVVKAAELYPWTNGHQAPMFIGAMIIGPLAAWVMKKFDQWVDGRLKPGFEMLVNNFSAGIIGLLMAIAGMFLLAPVVLRIVGWLGDGVHFLVTHHLLPLTSILIEPAKIFFLNNAINHGVLTPLGIEQAGEAGKSVLFLLEANPGPGLGILLAYMVFGRGAARASAPGAAIVHFLGGIHEIYFPYVLMKPKLILAAVAGGMTGVFINVMFDVGLRAPAAPGSIIAIYLQTASDSYLGVTLSVLAATLVSFAVAALLLKTDKATDDGDLSAATASMESMKGKKSSVSGVLAGDTTDGSHEGPIRTIVFACDAGMGSSAMGASVLRKKVQQAGFADVSVTNKAIANLTDTVDLVVSHQDLTPRARQRTGSAIHVSVDNFMNSPRYDEIVDLLERTNREGVGRAETDVDRHAAVAAPTSAPADSQSTDAAGASSPLPLEGIRLGGRADSRDAAIDEAGQLLLDQGAVDQAYVDSMHEREASVSTYMGNLLAIPHGTNEAKSAIRRTGLSFVRYDEPVDWNGQPVRYVVGIAGVGDDHLAILAQLAGIFLDEEKVAQMDRATSPEEIQRLLSGITV